MDGFRGLALVAVLLFHSGFRWARGGFLGVTAFFVLSGFLITGLLLGERHATGTVDLRAFWARRARRLVPAALVLVGLVIGYLAVGARHPSASVLGDGMAATAWVANWRFVFAHQSYAAPFSDPSPFQHMWSLAIEEQFYLVLPLLASVLLGRGRGPARRRRFGAVLVVAAVASAVAAAALHAPGSTSARAYYGTDTRAVEPLIGVLLALVLLTPAGLRGARLRRWGRVLLDAASLASLAGLAVLVTRLTDHSDALYRGGFVLTALLSAVVIVAATQPRTVIARVLATPPFVALGRLSYGAYLYHWPVFLWLTPRSTGLGPLPLLALRSAVTLALATLSFVLVERPIRTGRLPGRVALAGWANAAVGLLAGLVAVTATAAPASTNSLFASGPLDTAPPVPVLPTTALPTTTTGAAVTTTSPVSAPVVANTTTTGDAGSARATTATSAGSGTTSRGTSSPPPNFGGPPPGPAPAPPTTSTASAPTGPPPLKVALVGDSMANGLAKGLNAWAQNRNDIVVYNLSTSGCPLSRGGSRHWANGDGGAIGAECGWWADPNSDRSVKFTQFHPDVVVMQDGMNEVPDRSTPSWSGYRRPGDPIFDSWLINEYSAALNTFTHGGASVLHLNAVCADWRTMASGWFVGYADNGDGDRRVAALDNVSSTLSVTGTKVIDYFTELCPNGKFSATVAGVSDARPDGYHLSDAAATALAAKWLGPLVLQTAGRPTS